MSAEADYQNAISDLPQRTPERSIVFYSFPWSRFLAGILFTGIGIINFILLGYSIGAPDRPLIGTYIGTGTAVFLGGVSFFYVSGLPCLIFGIGCIIYSVAAIWKGKFNIDNIYLLLFENRGVIQRKTAINIEKIKKIQLNTARLGPKFLWLFIWVPMILFLFQFGGSIFNQPRAESNLLPWVLVITAIVDSVALAILLLYPQWYLHFETEDSFFELWFQPIKSSRSKWIQFLDHPKLHFNLPNIFRRKSDCIYGISLFLLGFILFYIEIGFDPFVTIPLMIYAIFILSYPDTLKSRAIRLFQLYLIIMMGIELIFSLIFIDLSHILLLIELIFGLIVIFDLLKIFFLKKNASKQTLN